MRTPLPVRLLPAPTSVGRALLIGAALAGCAPGAAAEDVKSRTTRVVDPAVRMAFYRSGGRHLIGRKIHLHVEARVLRQTPSVVPSKHDGDFLIFANRTVPVVVESRNRYWKQVARHLDDAGEFCLRGTLHVPETDSHRRVHLFVKSIKRAPGTWRARSDD